MADVAFATRRERRAAEGRTRSEVGFSSRAARRATEREARERRRRTGAINRRRRNRKWRAVAGLALVLALIVVGNLTFRLGLVPSASMEPTLDIGDVIAINTWSHTVRRGDIVVFEDPGDWLPADLRTERSDPVKFLDSLTGIDSSALLIKRVVGVPGDHVVCCENGNLAVNGTPYVEDYARDSDYPRQFDIFVPAGSLWVMGDNRGNSTDSRVHGSISDNLVIGTVPALLWPLSHLQLL